MNTFPARTLFLAAALAFGLLPERAAAQIRWRVSVKFILDANGNPPTTGNIAFPNGPSNQVVFANSVLAASGRGYRMEIVETLLLPGVSQWFNTSAGGGSVQDLEEAAKANKSLYKWSDDAINVYVNGAGAGGNWGETVLVGANNGSKGWVILHECSHYLSLEHTQTGQSFQNANGTPCQFDDDEDPCDVCATVIPGNDDGMADTLPDSDCWVANPEESIAQNAYGRSYASLAEGSLEKKRVDETRYNIMSYHSSRDRFTSDQLDATTDSSNGERQPIATGRSWFVDHTNTAIGPAGNSQAISVPLVGLFGGPFPSVQAGVAVASANDIVIIRPGTYTDTTRFDKALTLRATRGNAVLRTP